jgi:hypothetical protein
MKPKKLIEQLTTDFKGFGCFLVTINNTNSIYSNWPGLGLRHLGSNLNEVSKFFQAAKDDFKGFEFQKYTEDWENEKIRARCPSNFG